MHNYNNNDVNHAVGSSKADSNRYANDQQKTAYFIPLSASSSNNILQPIMNNGGNNRYN